MRSAENKWRNNTVCYKKAGCFYLGYPWTPSDSELYYVPQHPRDINIKFFLLTRSKYGVGRTEIKHGDEITSRNWTFIIIHGFFSSSSADWVNELGQALINKGDHNIISVDWSKGSFKFNYMQAVSNARVVAALLSRFLKKLIKYESISPSKLHLIGHSLGAHLASYVGLEIPGLARITGLDPSLPAFTLKENLIRLDPGDAKFVDVIHTNAGTFGHGETLGHVDFYLNGGSFQPGCSFEDVSKRYKSGIIMEYLRCSHSRSHLYYIESLQNGCKFWGRPWNLNGSIPDQSQPCDEETCQVMGLESSSLPGRGVFYIQTNSHSPFCKADTREMKFREDFSVLRNGMKSYRESSRRKHHKKHLPDIRKIIHKL